MKRKELLPKSFSAAQKERYYLEVIDKLITDVSNNEVAERKY